MKTIIKANDRGQANHGWLQSAHTFSFADYYNPERMGFSVLRVINEDFIAGGTGFGMHPHRDMEIISYVVEGALEHKDSMGTESVIRPGEVQRMSAGTGVRHSEYNPDANNRTHLLQIWLLPEKTGIKPSYEQKSYEHDLSSNDLVLVASKSGRDGSVTINQDVNLYACKSTQAKELSFKTLQNRNIWLQNIKGVLQVDDSILEPGDAISFEKTELIKLKSQAGSEFLIFDLP
mgnify:CR=1 FL=1